MGFNNLPPGFDPDGTLGEELGVICLKDDYGLLPPAMVVDWQCANAIGLACDHSVDNEEGEYLRFRRRWKHSFKELLHANMDVTTEDDEPVDDDMRALFIDNYVASVFGKFKALCEFSERKEARVVFHKVATMEELAELSNCLASRIEDEKLAEFWNTEDDSSEW